MILTTTELDYPAIREIGRLQFGMRIPKSSIAEDVSLKCSIDGTVVGFGTGTIAKPDERVGMPACGILLNVAVHPDWTGRGIATDLVREVCRRVGDIPIVAYAWRSQVTGKINIGGVLERLGFRQLKEVDRFWEGTDCVECGRGSCTCSAVIFVKDQE